MRTSHETAAPNTIQRVRRLVTKVAVGGAVAGAAFSAAAIAQAAVVSPDNQITACTSPTSPALRVIEVDKGQACATGESTLSWARGLRFKGEYSGTPNYKAGDVVLISKYYNTGCTTPKGTWVALIDGASPCTERPESWAILSLTGPSTRYRGVWSVPEGTTGPGKIPYSQADPVQKGDIIRYDGPEGQFGCTSPRGTWISVVGSHSYPCTEFPQNWVLIARDPIPPVDPGIHWAKIEANGSVLASSDSGVTTSGGSGVVALTFPKVDPTKCALTATVRGYANRTTITAEAYYGYVLVTTKDTAGNFAPAPFDVQVLCGKNS